MSLRMLRSDRAETGQSIVELALTLPVLLLLLLGTVDVGRVFFDYIEMRNAVSEGATYASRHPTDTAGIVTVADRHGIPDGTLVTSVISGECVQPSGGGSVTVIAERTFTPLFLGGLNAVAPDLDWTFNVRATSTIRCMT